MKERERPPERARHIKKKALPLRAWTGPEGSRNLMLPDFMTVGT